ncbi:DUF5696 domain-containing protein [Paenibacillus sp. NEAU-GSW1]|uniref:DUF5696 domain-containing protein n=1 Tax=Paenibacillus sp. NEAU-GSW1 TaxID=2682486 RepID=UPI0012E157BF|nr:hypothetical protein [Paenibacillus sp. NEAU-GSW1]
MTAVTLQVHEDEEIPFYQMVVRGYIDYTGMPYNLSTFTDMNQYILKCLEYGKGGFGHLSYRLPQWIRQAIQY